MVLFSVIFHHMGHFIHDKHVFYKGENETNVEGQNNDMWSFFEVVSLVKCGVMMDLGLEEKSHDLMKGFYNSLMM